MGTFSRALQYLSRGRPATARLPPASGGLPAKAAPALLVLSRGELKSTPGPRVPIQFPSSSDAEQDYVRGLTAHL